MRLSLTAAVAVPVLLAGCIPPSAPPAPEPAPPLPVPAPPPPPPAGRDWRDWPVTPGDWRYERQVGGSSATYGGPGGVLLRVRCDAGRAIILSKPGVTSEPVTVRTSTTVRALALQPAGGSPGQVAASLPVSDRLLDAMGFSRGHFTVESAGRAPLVLPAWPEVLRVAEDCRG